eukprot:CAMPEP_0197591140 /NCGR_PEP_ID=MMETSP1326-20131121/12894_1 /TAXON_ID=1155430 /ORGANISM="Genus nov. species nov., Strain RCC2288" /LENGTH=209 /DNA_ID=CAMNT_0043156511 /DNA_START=219 /DNA_END=844 /DNA_ORIENTATION=-
MLGGGIGRFMRRQAKEEAAAAAEKKLGGYDIDPELEEKIGKTQLKDLQRKYSLFDADGSGFINATELGDVLRAVGLNPIEARVHELLALYDADQSGTLSFAEFVQLWSDELLDAEDDELMFQRAFQFFDKDGNGDISLDEFREVLTELGDPLEKAELDLFFRLVDKNGDGRLQYDEFLGFLRGEREVEDDVSNEVSDAGAGGGDGDGDG